MYLYSAVQCQAVKKLLDTGMTHDNNNDNRFQHRIIIKCLIYLLKSDTCYVNTINKSDPLTS